MHVHCFAVFGLLLLLLANVIATDPNFAIGMKVLVLTSGVNYDLLPGLDFAQKSLTGQGIDFDVLTTDQVFNRAMNMSTGNLPLTEADGSPRYQGVILTFGNLGSPDNLTSTLSNEHWNQLLEYRRKFAVRLLSFYSNPTTVPRLGRLYSECNTDYLPAHIVPDADAAVSGDFNWNGVAAATSDWRMDQALMSRCSYNPSTTDATKVQPLLRFSSRASGFGHAPADTHAAAIIEFPDGTEEMHFFFVDHAWEPIAAPKMAAASIPWLLRDFFIGMRRMNFLVQLDDLFASSLLWNITEKRPGNDTEARYRCNERDMAQVAVQQKRWNSELPANSSIAVSFPFNGWYANPAPGADFLYEHMRDVGRQEFYFLSHTWEHINLDARNYENATFDFQKNIDFINDHLFSDGMHLERYSSKSAVTGEISGLENGEALRAMWDVGIR